MSDGFDWFDNENVVVPEQMAIAVYTNPRGDIVVRQHGDYPDDDVYIIVAPAHAVTLCRAIGLEAGLQIDLVSDRFQPVDEASRQAATNQLLPAPAPARPTARKAAADGELPLVPR